MDLELNKELSHISHEDPFFSPCDKGEGVSTSSSTPFSEIRKTTGIRGLL